MPDPPDAKWLSFYGPILGSDDAMSFISHCEAGPSGNKAKIIAYQGQRLVTIADDLLTIRPGRESLHLLFLMICSEHAAKLADGFDGEGKSRFYVKKFFRDYASADERAILGNGLVAHGWQPLGWEKAVDILYDVRCDVVHEGNYWGFHFYDDMNMINIDPDVIVQIPLSAVREIVIRGTVRAARSLITWPVAV